MNIFLQIDTKTMWDDIQIRQVGIVIWQGWHVKFATTMLVCKEMIRQVGIVIWQGVVGELSQSNVSECREYQMIRQVGIMIESNILVSYL